MLVVTHVCVCVCVFVCVCVCVATISGVSPSTIPIAASQSVAINGASMPNVSGDAAAFVVAVSCSAPSWTSPSTVSSTSATNVWNGATSITASVSSNGAVAGSYELCVRWSAVSPYFRAGAFAIVSVTSVVPSVIPALATTVSVVVSGVSLVNVNGDGQAFVVSSTSCSGGPTSVVTSVASSYSSSTSVTLTVSDSGAVAGVYSVCMRVSATTVYFSSGLTLTIGELMILYVVLFMCVYLCCIFRFSHNHVV